MYSVFIIRIMILFSYVFTYNIYKKNTPTNDKIGFM